MNTLEAGIRVKFFLEVAGTDVLLRVDCGDAYRAQVMYDDILDRLKDGEVVSFYGTPGE
jgi:hypothetical protein